MSDLHQTILAEIDRHERVSGPGLEPVFNALRAAVERHAICVKKNWRPCDDLRAIADALGLKS